MILWLKASERADNYIVFTHSSRPSALRNEIFLNVVREFADSSGNPSGGEG